MGTLVATSDPSRGLRVRSLNILQGGSEFVGRNHGTHLEPQAYAAPNSEVNWSSVHFQPSIAKRVNAAVLDQLLAVMVQSSVQPV